MVLLAFPIVQLRSHHPNSGHTTAIKRQFSIYFNKRISSSSSIQRTTNHEPTYHLTHGPSSTKIANLHPSKSRNDSRPKSISTQIILISNPSRRSHRNHFFLLSQHKHTIISHLCYPLGISHHFSRSIQIMLLLVISHTIRTLHTYNHNRICILFLSHCHSVLMNNISHHIVINHLENFINMFGHKFINIDTSFSQVKYKGCAAEHIYNKQMRNHNRITPSEGAAAEAAEGGGFLSQGFAPTSPSFSRSSCSLSILSSSSAVLAPEPYLLPPSLASAH